MSGIFNLFAGLELLISCLGLYGLSAYGKSDEKFEIGMKQVAGASTDQQQSILPGFFPWRTVKTGRDLAFRMINR